MQFKKSGMIEIRNPRSSDRESGNQYLESGIYGMQSRIQDCLGFPLLEKICSVPTIKIAALKEEIVCIWAPLTITVLVFVADGFCKRFGSISTK